MIIVYRIDPALAPLIIQKEEFYVADRREGQAQKAKEILQKMLKPMGIIVEKVLTKDYRFNPKYQQAIEDKKVADQKVEKYTFLTVLTAWGY